MAHWDWFLLEASGITSLHCWDVFLPSWKQEVSFPKSMECFGKWISCPGFDFCWINVDVDVMWDFTPLWSPQMSLSTPGIAPVWITSNNSPPQTSQQQNNPQLSSFCPHLKNLSKHSGVNSCAWLHVWVTARTFLVWGDPEGSHLQAGVWVTSMSGICRIWFTVCRQPRREEWDPAASASLAPAALGVLEAHSDVP